MLLINHFKSPSLPTDSWVYLFILFQVTKSTNGRLSLPFHLVSSHQVHQRTLEFTLSSCFKSPSSLTDAWVYLFILFQVTKFIKSRVDSRKCLSKAEWILANVYRKPSEFSQIFIQSRVDSRKTLMKPSGFWQTFINFKWLVPIKGHLESNQSISIVSSPT
jgi:hypothetical protein